MKNNISKFIQQHKRIILSLIIIFLITLIFPFSGDDWQWKFQNWQTIKEFPINEYLNGRYLGNILVVIMTKNSILRGLFMSIVLTTIGEIITRKTKVGLPFIWAIILCIPLVVFRQSIPWTSGFTNYVISTLFLLLDIITAEKLYNNEYHFPKVIASCFLFYASCLFIENLTIFLILATITLNIIYFCQNKKVNKALLLIFASTLLGALTMFIHPAYFKVLNGSDGYRTFGNSIKEIIEVMRTNLESVIHRFLIFECLVTMSLITVFMFVYYYKHKNNYKNKKAKIINLLFAYQLIFIVYSFLYHLNIDWQILLRYTVTFNTLISILYCITILVSACLIYSKKDLKDIIPYFIIIIGLTAPLCVVTPIGGRNFFAIYIMEVMLICSLYKKAEIKIDKIIMKASSLVLIVLVTYYISIYGYVYLVNNKRLNYIREQSSLGNTQIKVPYLPYKDYIHGEGNFDSEYYGPIYKIAYNLDPNIDFEFMPYDQWLQEINK